MARALGSYPSCHRFESSRRYHPEEAALAASSGPALISAHLGIRGPVVKRLRHRPFTAVTRVRFPSGSPIRRLSSAGRALASHARGHRFEFCSLHQKAPDFKRNQVLFVTFLPIISMGQNLGQGATQTVTHTPIGHNGADSILRMARIFMLVLLSSCSITPPFSGEDSLRQMVG